MLSEKDYKHCKLSESNSKNENEIIIRQWLRIGITEICSESSLEEDEWVNRTDSEKISKIA